jgi:hypothetical protein
MDTGKRKNIILGGTQMSRPHYFLYKKDAGGTPAFPAKIFFSNLLKFKI